METIKIDNETIRVADLPNELQNMVVLYETVIQKEVDASIELALQQAAKVELTRRVVAGYREHKAAEMVDPIAADLTPSELAEDAGDEITPTK